MTVLQAMRLCNRGGWTCEWTGDGRVCIYLWRYDQREYADSFVEAVSKFAKAQRMRDRQRNARRKA